ncbi:MAG: DUF4389 domain-containing protein [Parvibaculum sp.]
MSDTSTGSGNSSGHDAGSDVSSARKELGIRLLYMVAFWFLAHIAFSVAIFLAVLQFVVVLLTGEKNEELRKFSRNLIQYIWECLAFLIFAREEKPFPLGRFPSVTSPE